MQTVPADVKAEVFSRAHGRAIWQKSHTIRCADIDMIVHPGALATIVETYVVKLGGEKLRLVKSIKPYQHCLPGESRVSLQWSDLEAS